MAVWYVRPEVGSDGNDGTSWGSAKARFDSITPSPGDTIRIEKSPDRINTGIDATWTYNLEQVYLNQSVTENIDLCDSTGVPSSNVTVANSTLRREGTYSTQVTVGGSFGTGLAYISNGDLGAGKNLSEFSRLSFSLRTTQVINSGDLSIKLYDDATSELASFTFEHQQVNGFVAMVTDSTTIPDATVASWGLYVNNDLGASDVNLYIDNIIACRPESDPAALTLKSLVGPKNADIWSADTTYSLGDIVTSTRSKHKVITYKCTQAGPSGSTEPNWPDMLEETIYDGSCVWTSYGFDTSLSEIMSINDSTVWLSKTPSNNPSSKNVGFYGMGWGWVGESLDGWEAVQVLTMYRQECFREWTPFSLSENGTQDSPITYSGGWDASTDQQVGDTFFDGQSGLQHCLYDGARIGISYENISLVRWRRNLYHSGFINLSRAYLVANIEISYLNGHHNRIDNVILCNSSSFAPQYSECEYIAFRTNGANAGGWRGSFGKNYQNVCPFNNGMLVTYENNEFRQCLLIGPTRDSRECMYPFRSPKFSDLVLRTREHFGTSSYGSVGTFPIQMRHPRYLKYIGDVNVFVDTFDGTWGDNRIWEATIERNLQTTITPPGQNYAWEIEMPLLLNNRATFNENYPQQTRIGSVAYKSGIEVSLSLQARRDSTNFYGALLIPGHQIPGINQDMSSNITAAADTWQTLSLDFTPSSDGIAEVEFRAWQTEDTAGNLYISDFKVG